MALVAVKCPICGREFRTWNLQPRPYCSVACEAEAVRGDRP